jgi:hypothetical protein
LTFSTAAEEAQRVQSKIAARVASSAASQNEDSNWTEPRLLAQKAVAALLLQRPEGHGLRLSPLTWRKSNDRLGFRTGPQSMQKAMEEVIPDTSSAVDSQQSLATPRFRQRLPDAGAVLKSNRILWRIAMLIVSTLAAAPRAVLAVPTDQTLVAFDWINKLSAPAALVAGAALASVYEVDKDLQPVQGDSRGVSLLKKLAKQLYLSAFTLEIACVFVTTVTGTMMLGKGVPNPMAERPLQMLQREAEFEFLFSRVSFFQGLLNWLGGVAVTQLIPRPDNTRAGQRLQISSSAAIATTILYIIAFYNKHTTFYKNYGMMLVRLAKLTIGRYYLEGFRILPVIALLPLSLAIKNGVQSVWEHDTE